MKKLSWAVLAGLLFFTGPLWAKSNELPKSDVNKNNAVTESFSKAVLARDWVKVGELYTEDAVLYAPNEPRAQGQAAVRASMEKIPPLSEFKLINTKVEGRDDLAYVTGMYAMTIPLPDGAAPVKASGNYVEIRRKQPDGRWLIAVDIYNSDQPPPPAKPVQ